MPINIDFREVFKKKSVGTLALGVILMIASIILNSSTGLYTSILIILFALITQAITWFNYWSKGE